MRPLIIATAAILAVTPLAAQASSMYPQQYSYSTTYVYPTASSAQVLRLPDGYREAATVNTTERTGYGSYPAQYPQYQPAPYPAARVTQTVTTTTVPASVDMMPVYDTMGTPLVTYVSATQPMPAIPTSPCRSDNNHRSNNKGMDTSTTVYGDCLN